MNEIVKRYELKKQHKREMYKRILLNIRNKIVFFNENNLKFFLYEFKDINYNGLPLFNNNKQLKLKKYIMKSLIKEGFVIKDISDHFMNKILIMWK